MIPLPTTNVEFTKCWGIKYPEGDYSGLHNQMDNK